VQILTTPGFDFPPQMAARYAQGRGGAGQKPVPLPRSFPGGRTARTAYGVARVKFSRETHKGRYVYYRCTGYKGRCPEKYAREESITGQFAELLKGRRLDDDVKGFLTKALRLSYSVEKRFHDEALARLTADYEQLQNRLDQMYVDKLDGKISVSFYERKAGEWRAEQDRIAEAMRDHRQADRSYSDTGIELLELASGAHDAFMSQGSDELRRLLQLVVSNSTWKHGQLGVQLHPPLDLILIETGKARDADAADAANGVVKADFAHWRRGRVAERERFEPSRFPLTRPALGYSSGLAMPLPNASGSYTFGEYGTAGGDLVQHGRDLIDRGGDLFADGVPAAG
jgi:hypothetical protein